MSISKTFLRCTFTLAASAAVLGGSTHALACQYAKGTSDTALMNTFTIPPFSSAKDFVLRQASDFNISPFAWKDHGLEAYDDPQFEYTKHWMSSYLIAKGADFEHRAKGVDSNGQELDLLIDRAFHSPRDYYTMAKGEETFGKLLPAPCGSRAGFCREPLWHHDFVSLLGGSDPVTLGLHQWSEHPPISSTISFPLALFPETTESVTTFCGLYDVQDSTDAPPPQINIYLPGTQNIYGTPAERASVLVHEGMHAHYLNVDSLDHVNCLSGARDSGGGCDHFFSHPKADYAGDDLNRTDAHTHKISAYEIGLEYLCDLLDEGKDWVPVAVLADAEGAANRLSTGAFVDSNGRPVKPPYACSVPSPMMDVPASGCSLGTCDGSAKCSSGEACFRGCCVVFK